MSLEHYLKIGMMVRCAFLCLVLLFVHVGSAVYAAPLDCSTDISTNYSSVDVRSLIRIKTQADVAIKRQKLIEYIWNGSGFPTNKSPHRVVRDIESPLSGIEDLARADQYEVVMEMGFRSIAYHFIPRAPNGRLVLYHQGHWGDLRGGKMQSNIGRLLESGFEVVAFFMPVTGPNAGPCATHNDMAALSSPTFCPIRVFLEPVAIVVNYLRSRGMATNITMMGTSGGGWTTTLYAALDPRIAMSFPVAGSLPEYLRAPPCGAGDVGDYEQTDPGLYSIANYLELYVMGAVGEGRAQVQILNQYDTCCFGGVRYKTYAGIVSEIVSGIGMGRFDVFLDNSFVGHELSVFGLERGVLPVLGGLFTATGHSLQNGFRTNGFWVPSGGGYSGTYYSSVAGNGAVLATWRLPQVPVGRYTLFGSCPSQITDPVPNGDYVIKDSGGNLIATGKGGLVGLEAGFRSQGVSWRRITDLSVTATDDVVVGLAGAGDSTLVADAVRLVQVDPVLETAGCSITVEGKLASSQLINSLGNCLTGREIRRSVVVRNLGANPLTISSLGAEGSGFAVDSSMAPLVLNPGAATNVMVRFRAADAGNHTGVLRFSLGGDVGQVLGIPVAIQANRCLVADDADAGFSAGAVWLKRTEGFRSSIHYCLDGGASTCQWHFTDLPAGIYRAAATWSAHPNRTTNALYWVLGGAGDTVTSGGLNQEMVPADLEELGVGWARIGGPFRVTNGLCDILMASGRDGFGIANAVRLEFVGEEANSARVYVEIDGKRLDGRSAAVNFGSAITGSAVSKAVRLWNYGGMDLVVSAISIIHGGYSARAEFPLVIAPGESSLFSVVMDCTVTGFRSAVLRISTGDSTAPNVDVQLEGSVCDLVVLSPTGPNFVYQPGLWTTYPSGGGAAYQIAPPASDRTASWTTENLAAGYYQAFISWIPWGNRATNIGVRVFDERGNVFGSVSIDQTTPPSLSIFAGDFWRPITSVFSTMGGRLTTSATSQTNGYTVAQSVLIRKVPNPIFGPPATNLIYGTAISVGQLGLAANVAGGFILLPPGGTMLPVGVTKVVAVFTAVDTNYVNVSVTNQIAVTVTPAPLTITADDQSRIYGQFNPALTASYTGLVNGDTAAVVSGLSLGSPAVANSPVGTYPIRGSGATAANYTVSYADGALRVSPAPLTIKADDKRKLFGDPLPTFTASYTGLVAGDTAGSLGDQLGFTTTAVANSPLGSYAITPKGVTSANYTSTFASGALAVTVATTVSTVGIGGTGFRGSGGWFSVSSLGQTYATNYLAAAPGSGAVGMWNFTSLSPGLYRVMGTWLAHPNRASNVNYALSGDGGAVLRTVGVDQRRMPGDVRGDGAWWRYFGDVYAVTGGVFQVSLTGFSGGYAIADAVRMERVSYVSDGPRLWVEQEGLSGDGGLPPGSAGMGVVLGGPIESYVGMVSGVGKVDFGAAITGTPARRTLVVRNLGNQGLRLTGPVSLPVGFSVVSMFGTNVLVPGAWATVVLALDAGQAGQYGGVLSFGSSDPQTPIFQATLSGSVGTVKIVDDGNLNYRTEGYRQEGVWYPLTVGYGGQSWVGYSPSGTGTAEWRFSGLTPGYYRVSATWLVWGNPATNVSYTLWDGAGGALGGVAVDQRVVPNEFSSDGGQWKNLGGLWPVTGGAMTVRLTNNVPGWVSVDAVRVEFFSSAIVKSSSVRRADSFHPKTLVNQASLPAGAEGSGFLIRRSDVGWLLSWPTTHVLQSSQSPNGPWTDIPSAISPLTIGGNEVPRRFYRSHQRDPQ